MSFLFKYGTKWRWPTKYRCLGTKASKTWDCLKGKISNIYFIMQVIRKMLCKLCCIRNALCGSFVKYDISAKIRKWFFLICNEPAMKEYWGIVLFCNVLRNKNTEDVIMVGKGRRGRQIPFRKKGRLSNYQNMHYRILLRYIT